MNFTKRVESKVESCEQVVIENMMKEILPDNRPITGFKIVENLDKCPLGYQPIARTFDADADADLWRATSGLFVRNATARRYLCIGKGGAAAAAGPYHRRMSGAAGDGHDYVVDRISVIGDKERPPDGFTSLPKTSDTGQKAWRKRQLCYRLVRADNAKQCLTDVIVCSSARTKRPPDGFSLAGEINGVLVCYKSRDASAAALVTSSPPPAIPARLPPKPSPLIINGNNNEDGSKSFMTSPVSRAAPLRPAPTPPLPAPRSHPHNVNTLGGGGCGGPSLEGVPFRISDKISREPPILLPPFRGVQLGPDYDYNFSLEKQILNIVK